jgi:hypothetical protein
MSDENTADATIPEPSKPKPKPKLKLVKAAKATPREQSTIAFSYMDMDTAIPSRTPY